MVMIDSGVQSQLQDVQLVSSGLQEISCILGLFEQPLSQWNADA